MFSLSRRAVHILGGFLSVVALWSIGAPGVSALTVNPAVHDVVVDPGQTATRNITLQNEDRTTETYLITIQKFIPKGEFGQQQFLDPGDTNGLPEWMYVDRPEVTLSPGQSLSLPVSVRVPSDVQSGGYYAALFLSKKQAVGEEVAMLPRIGVLFFVRVNGPAIEKLALRDFAADSQNVYAHLPVGFRVSLVNEGNVHLVPQGTITVRNMFGSTVAKLPVNPGSGKVLPASERVLLASWSKGETSDGSGYWDGLMRELSNFALGTYRATLEMSGPGFSTPVTASASFAVWPWRTALALATILVALVVLFFVFKTLAIMSATAKSGSR